MAHDVTPCLDFVVIGAQKAGTTTLWQLLRGHPQLWLPPNKEAPYFSHTEEVYRHGIHQYLGALRAPGDGSRLRGTVTPHYMHGWRDASTAVIAARIAAEVPDIKLVALLRDPIARARSQHAMAVTRGVETRDFNAAVADLLHERGLREGRLAADDTNTYVVQGEYGRILGDYRAYFAPEQLYVRFTSELATDPEAVLRGVFEFLGVDSNFAPPSLGQRSFAGGKRPRADPAAVEQLVAEISATPPGARSHHTRGWVNGRRIDAPGVTELIAAVARVESPSAPLSDELRAELSFSLRKIWNVRPSAPPPMSAGTERCLAKHFLTDLPGLDELLGRPAPWEAELLKTASASVPGRVRSTARLRRAPV